MAEDCVNQAAMLARLAGTAVRHRTSEHSRLSSGRGEIRPLRVYGSDAPLVQELMRADPALAEPLDPALPYTGAEVVWAARTRWRALWRMCWRAARGRCS